jgi:hypothetical protein
MPKCRLNLPNTRMGAPDYPELRGAVSLGGRKQRVIFREFHHAEWWPVITAYRCT